MTFIEKIKTIERIDSLIKLHATGSADDLAARLKISRRSVYDILDIMRQMDAPIEYCQSRKSFYYRSNCNLSLGFVNTDKLKKDDDVKLTIN